MKNLHIKIFGIFYLSLISFSFTSCTLVDHDDQKHEGNNSGYASKEVESIFVNSCALSGCHSENSPSNGLNLTLQSELMNGATHRPLANNAHYGGDDVIPFNTEKSLLMQFVKGNITSKMSVDHNILTDSQISTLSKWIKDGAKNYNGEVPFENRESYRVYVCNSTSKSISTIDGTKKVVSHITDLGDETTGNDTPYWIEDSGAYYYVTFSKSNRFVKFRKSDNSVVGSISNILSAGVIKLTSDGSKAYVSRAIDSTATYNSIYVINTSSMTIKTTITFPFYGILHGLALDEGRKLLYVTDGINHTVHIVNTFNDTVIDSRFSLTQDFFPLYTEISKDGNYLYTTASNTNELLVSNAVSRVTLDRIPLLSTPAGVAVSSDGNKIYVASFNGNAIEVITKSGNFWSKTNTITHPTMSNPFALDITDDNSYLYVANFNGNGDFVPTYQVKGEKNISTITIINTSSESVEKVIEVEENAIGITVEK